MTKKVYMLVGYNSKKKDAWVAENIDAKAFSMSVGECLKVSPEDKRLPLSKRLRDFADSAVEEANKSKKKVVVIDLLVAPKYLRSLITDGLADGTETIAVNFEAPADEESFNPIKTPATIYVDDSEGFGEVLTISDAT